jgi:hypothetical protein
MSRSGPLRSEWIPWVLWLPFSIPYSLFPIPCFIHSPRATSGWGSTAAGRGWGRIRAKPARRIPYAARMLKAMEPTNAAINIVKFNKSVIFRRRHFPCGLERAAFPLRAPQKPSGLARESLS